MRRYNGLKIKYSPWLSWIWTKQAMENSSACYTSQSQWSKSCWDFMHMEEEPQQGGADKWPSGDIQSMDHALPTPERNERKAAWLQLTMRFQWSHTVPLCKHNDRRLGYETPVSDFMLDLSMSKAQLLCLPPDHITDSSSALVHIGDLLTSIPATTHFRSLDP